jgi:hypothetical protein
MTDERNKVRAAPTVGPPNDASRAKSESMIKKILIFAMHQFIGTWGVAIVAPFVVAASFDVLRDLNFPVFTSRNSSQVLTNLPWFPAQTALALWFGWLLGRRLHHRAMLWVWILPLVFLGCALIVIPTLTPSLVPPEFQAGVGQSRLSHYFGLGCRPENFCVDQMEITMPFYASVFYSLGAYMSGRLVRTTDRVESSEGNSIA